MKVHDSLVGFHKSCGVYLYDWLGLVCCFSWFLFEGWEDYPPESGGVRHGTRWKEETAKAIFAISLVRWLLVLWIRSFEK